MPQVIVKGISREKTAALADLLLAEGSRPVEIIYQNLDMDDFYEYKGE